MTKEQYNEMKEEFAAVTYKFEQLNKEIVYFREKYAVNFFHITESSKNLIAETTLLSNLIALKAKGESEEKINTIRENFTAKALEQESLDIKGYNNQVEVAKRREEYKREDLEKFEEEFQDFILNYHPYVNINLDQQLSNVVKLLLRCYYENNIEGFKEVFKMNEKGFIHEELDSSLYTKCEGLYLEFKVYYQKYYNEVKDKFPMNKREIYSNDDSIRAERDLLTIENNKYKTMNEAIHKDYITQFGTDYNIPFQIK